MGLSQFFEVQLKLIFDKVQCSGNFLLPLQNQTFYFWLLLQMHGHSFNQKTWHVDEEDLNIEDRVFLFLSGNTIDSVNFHIGFGLLLHALDDIHINLMMAWCDNHQYSELLKQDFSPFFLLISNINELNDGSHLERNF